MKKNLVLKYHPAQAVKLKSNNTIALK